MYDHQAYSRGCTYGLLWFTASDLCLIARQGAVAVKLVQHWLRIYSRALGSVVEHRLHTAGVSGSNPLAPTIFLAPVFRCWLLAVGSVCFWLSRYGTGQLCLVVEFTSTLLSSSSQVAVGL